MVGKKKRVKAMKGKRVKAMGGKKIEMTTTKTIWTLRNKQNI